MKPEIDDRDVIFQPNPGPQTDFLAAPEFQVLYGGAAGGGKSFALLADPLRYMDHPSFSGLLLRRTNDDLRDLITESEKLYPRAIPGTKFHQQKSTWITPNGGRLWMTYLDHDKDVSRFIGQAYTWVGFDELTLWPTSYPWEMLTSRVRSADPFFQDKLYMRATTNPGGIGHMWVKKMFIDPAPWGEPFVATDLESGKPMYFPDDDPISPGEPLFKRRFIPAKLEDNPYLYNDGAYRRGLLGLNDQKKRQLLYGDWDVAEGAAFSEFKREVHTCEPFEIPDSWKKFRACDYGYGSYAGVLWFAITPEDQLIIYREMYVHKVLAVDLARMILEAEKHDHNLMYGVLDSSTWHKRGDPGPSIAEQMIAQGCRWRPSDRSPGSRISGKNEVHRRLQVNEYTEEPGLVIFNTCRNLISQLPVIPLDANNPEDVDTDFPHDHLYDALRYGVMTRPRNNIWDWYEPNEAEEVADAQFGY